MISFPLETIFVHVPRCAGTSVERAIWLNKSDRTLENLWGNVFDGQSNPLQTGGMQHLTATHIRGLYPIEFEKFWKFSIVRNPFDRIVSQYYYTIRGRPDLLKYLGFSRIRIRYGKVPFGEYVSRIMQRTHVQWLPAAYFVTDLVRGGLLVDHIARYEDLTEDWDVIRKRLGLKKELRRAKTSGKRPHYTEVIGHSSRRKLEAFYREDLEMFEYAF